MKINFGYHHLYWDLCWLPFWMYWIYHPVDWISKLGSELASRATCQAEDHWILQSLSAGCNNVKTAIDHFLIAAFSCTHFDLQNFFSLVFLLDNMILLWRIALMCMPIAMKSWWFGLFWMEVLSMTCSRSSQKDLENGWWLSGNHQSQGFHIKNVSVIALVPTRLVWYVCLTIADKTFLCFRFSHFTVSFTTALRVCRQVRTSLQTAGNRGNLLVTKAIRSLFSVMHYIPLCDWYHFTTTGNLYQALSSQHFFPNDPWLTGGHQPISRYSWWEL